MKEIAEKILYDSDAAAKKMTVTGWVSSDGRFFGENEHLARWAGCTHKICECGNEHEKSWTICGECRDKKEVEKYQSKEFKEWNDEPLFSEACHEYFFDEESLLEYCHFNDISHSDLKLVICEPIYARIVEEDYWYDDLPEDTYLNDAAPEIADALLKLNEIIIKKRIILSWLPGKYRTSITDKK